MVVSCHCRCVPHNAEKKEKEEEGRRADHQGGGLARSHWHRRIASSHLADPTPHPLLCLSPAASINVLRVCIFVSPMIPLEKFSLSNEQERFSSKLLRGVSPTKRRQRRRRRSRRRLVSTAPRSTFPGAAAGARRAASPNLLHDQTRRGAVPDAFGLLLRIEPSQQELAILRVVREASTETYPKHDAAQHRARHAGPNAAAAVVAYAARGDAPQTVDRFPHALADLGTAWVFARYHRV